MIDQIADLAANAIDLDKLMQQATASVTANGEGKAPDRSSGKGLRLAVARDPAFQFYYADLFDALRNRGVELCYFSPLADDAVPHHCDGLYLGGGYPELHAQQLAGNNSMLQSVAEFCNSGKPVYAECGGLIYLCRDVETRDGSWPMVGILPSRARMLEKRKTLGYVEATLQEKTFFGEVGTTLRGHEFHYSELCEEPIGREGWQSAYRLKKNRGGQVRDEGYQKGNILASYAHLHLASQPQALDALIERLTLKGEATRSKNETS